MSPAEFVAALKEVAYQAAVRGSLDILKKPPGRRPKQDLVELGTWFSGLSAQDQQQVARAMDLAASQALYNVLLVLDGLLAIEPQGQKGDLHLVFADRGGRRRLNDPSTPQLSVLFKEIA